MTNILAFDTSGPHCVAALMRGGKIVAEQHEEMIKGQAERLFPMCEVLLASEGMDWAQLDAIGTGIGPGNFTGIRIAVSAARGLALSLDIPAIGVSSFEALRSTGFAQDGDPMIVSLPATRRGADVILQYYANTEPLGEPLELAILGEGTIDPSFKGFPTLAKVVGYEANAVDFALQGEKGGGTELRFGPDYNQASQIAHCAARHLNAAEEIPRPKPLYLRPADAAPGSDPPPVILP